MADVNANVEIFLAATVLGVALILLVLAVLAFRRLGESRLLMLAFSFGAFALKGAYLTWMSWETRGSEAWILPVAALDLVILGFQYLAVRKR